MDEPNFHQNLKGGTIFRHTLSPTRIKLVQDMDGLWAYVEQIKKDNTRDMRTRGWSTYLTKAEWVVDV